MKRNKEKLSKTLSPIRIGERTEASMQKAIAEINKKNLFKISELEFRRMALFYFSQKVIDVKGEVNKLIETIPEE